jgi:2-oxoglutarate ferredoxin oxidoreductase subunit alpha
MFARACAAGGLHIYGRREYYSNIMGRHSYFDVRVAPRPLTSHRSSIDLLTTFDAEALARHGPVVLPGGAIVYDRADGEVALEKIPFLDDRAKKDLTEYLSRRDQAPTTAGILADARARGVETFPVRFRELARHLAEDLELPQATADRALNTIAVSVSCALMRYDRRFMERALEKTFPGREKIIRMNVRAVELAYDWVEKNLDASRLAHRLVPRETSEARILVNGNQAVALGKIAGGLTFQTYYPISPATDESVYLEGREEFPLLTGEQGSVVVVQTEDEIAGITMAAGAALTGVRSATATSGPGFSLMAEGLGWAGINEVPVVVTLYQRGSPATGMPTRTEQGDLLFALHAGHGEFPRILLASGDLQEAFRDAAEAFNYAERFQMPVIHLLDKAMASTTQTLPPFDPSALRIERGLLFESPPEGNGRGPFARFEPTESGISARAVLGQPGGRHWLTGGEHTALGRVTEDPVVREQQMEKRARKLEHAAREIPGEDKLQVHGDPQAAFSVLSWGSNKGAILEALEALRGEGIQGRLVQVRLLWPFPAQELERALKGAAPLVIVEANYSGQFAQLLRAQTGREVDHLIVKYNGRPISGEEIAEALRSVAQAKAEARIVLRNPLE